MNSSRRLARQATVLIDRDESRGLSELDEQIVRNQIAYVHVLRTELRHQDLPLEVGRYLVPAVLSASNPANAILLETDRLCTQAQRRGLLGELSRLSLSSTPAVLTDAQGGLERIQKTPLPVQYRFLPRFFSRAFCVILPSAVVADLGRAIPIGSTCATAGDAGG